MKNNLAIRAALFIGLFLGLGFIALVLFTGYHLAVSGVSISPFAGI